MQQQNRGGDTRRPASTAHMVMRSTLLMMALSLFIATNDTDAFAQSDTGSSAVPIKERNLGVQRSRAASLPRSESDQAIVNGWPMYRTERGQQAFNDAMATLKATDVKAPAAAAFKNCSGLDCNLSLPPMSADGWTQAGRVWVSPNDYVLFVQSPKMQKGQNYRRRAARAMRYFVFHEFHNSSRNTDTFDTISSHSGAVFVPFYVSKPQLDARGQRFVMVVQVAPYDVTSIHATNYGSAGPGIEVARNTTDAIEPLQNLAGILVASITKSNAPHLRVVNHRGAEGQPMIAAYERRLSALQSRQSATPVTLPFVPASVQRVASVSGNIDDLVTRRGMSPRIPVAERSFVPPRTTLAAAAPEPQLVSPIRMAERTPREPELQLVEPIRPAPPRGTLRH